MGTLVGARLPGTFERWMNEGSRSVASLSLSLRELCEGYLEGVSFNEDPGGYVKESSGEGHLSS